VRRVTGPWNAAALPEIMAGALQESKRRVHGGGQTGEQQASNREEQPESEDVECASRVASPKPDAVELRNPTEA